MFGRTMLDMAYLGMEQLLQGPAIEDSEYEKNLKSFYGQVFIFDELSVSSTKRAQNEFSEPEQNCIKKYLRAIEEEVEYLKRQVEIGNVYPNVACDALLEVNRIFEEYGLIGKALPALNIADYEPLKFDLLGHCILDPA
jgi:hypothetical protein